MKATDAELKDLASTATTLASKRIDVCIVAGAASAAGMYAQWLVRAERASHHIYDLPFPTDEDYPND